MGRIAYERHQRLGRSKRGAAWLWSAWDGWRRRDDFDGVGRFCLFVGYARSGSTLLGSLLDAHAEACIGNEVDVLGFAQAGYSRRQLFALLRESASRFTESGREWTGYKYEVPGQWQGRYERLVVIGDKKAGRSTRRLAETPDLLDRMRETLGVPLRFVHVIRNPFDVIASRFRSNERLDLPRSAETFFRLAEGMAWLKGSVGADELLDAHHENVIEDPRRELSRLCEFVGLDAAAPYLDACASIVEASPRRARDKVQWPPGLVDTVQERSGEFPFLSHYTFD